MYPCGYMYLCYMLSQIYWYLNVLTFKYMTYMTLMSSMSFSETRIYNLYSKQPEKYLNKSKFFSQNFKITFEFYNF